MCENSKGKGKKEPPFSIFNIIGMCGSVIYIFQHKWHCWIKWSESDFKVIYNETPFQCNSYL